MELFKLLGTIAIDNAEANKALRDTSQEGSKAESKLGKVFGAIGKGAAVAGKAIAAGLAVGATAMAGLTVKALQASGDLEQNLGGAEAVFKDLGGSIKEMSTTIITGYDEATGKAITATSNLETVSKEAYKNMGLSQSDYLATANKMGALFQGAGFETQEALDLSSQAMQRAADVASIMGIDTEAAMEAVAGAAKGNFTMMDNLGVAMNDTAIGAYALEKGINKSTTEMSQQEKIGLAMEMFLEKTSYAAGNYAKENETLAGSLSTAKSALTNFLSGSGDVDSFVDSISNLADVVVKSLDEIVPRLTEGLVDIVSKISEKLPGLIQSVLPTIVSGAVTLVNGLVEALPGVIEALMACLPDLIQGVVDILSGLISAIVEAAPMLIEGIVEAFNQIVAALPDIIQQIVSALPTLIPALIDGLVNIVVTLCQNFSEIIQPLIDALPEIIISVVEALMENLPALIEGLISLILGIVEAIPQIIQGLVDALPTVISLIVEGLLSNLPALIMGLIRVVWGIVVALPQIYGPLIASTGAFFVGIWEGIKKTFSGVGEWFGSVFKGAWEGIKTAWNAVTQWFSNLWEGIKKVFSVVGEWFSDIFSSAWEGIKTAWNAVVSFFQSIWNGIKNVFKTVASWFKNIFTTAWNGIKSAWNGVKSFFSDIWEGVKSTFSGVASWFGDIFSSAWEKVKGAFSGFTGFFSGLWESIKETFSSLGTKISDAIGGAVKAGINKVISLIETTINSGIGLINGAIGLINELPGVSVGKVKKLSLPRLAKGGVLEKGQVGLLEGSGAEAVVPLENNAGWISKTAEDLKRQLAKEGVLGNDVTVDDVVINTGAGNKLAEGIADGISKQTEGIEDTVASMGQSVLSTAKSSFGKTAATAEKLSTAIVKAAKTKLEEYKQTNDMTLADEQLYWQRISSLCEAGTAGRIEADEKYLEAKDSVDQEILSAAQTRFDNYLVYNEMSLADEVAYWDAVRANCQEGTQARIDADAKYFAAKKSLNEELVAAEETLESSLKEIYQKIDDRTSEIIGTFSLFEEYTEGNSKPKDWFEMNDALDSQIEALEMYDAEMESLESKIGGTALYDELAGMGIKGLSQIQYMNSLTDAHLQQYLEKYEKREALAKDMATDELAEESIEAAQTAYSTFAETCDSLGVAVSGSVHTMQVSLTESFDTVGASITTLHDKLMQLKETLGFPSFNFEGNFKFGSNKTEGETGVEWYAKAMNSPRILNEPTIFGYDSASGKYLGGGESGSEVVAGSQTLMSMIQTAVAEQNTTITIWLQKVFDVLAEYFPQMLDALEAPIDFNPNSMASALAVPMNRELGKISSRKDRGR